MTDEAKVLAEAKSAEAVNAVAVAEEAKQNAHFAQMQDAIISALKNVLQDEGDDQRPILIKRIPFICTDIIDMKGDIANINDNIKWATRSVIGAVLVGLVGLVFIVFKA